MLSGGGDGVGGELTCKLPAPFVQAVLPRCGDDRSLPPRRLATWISWMLLMTCRVRSAACRLRAAVRRKISRDISDDPQKLVKGRGEFGEPPRTVVPSSASGPEVRHTSSTREPKGPGGESHKRKGARSDAGQRQWILRKDKAGRGHALPSSCVRS